MKDRLIKQAKAERVRYMQEFFPAIVAAALRRFRRRRLDPTPAESTVISLGERSQVSSTDAVGYVAASMVLATFCMKAMIPLRVVAIA